MPVLDGDRVVAALRGAFARNAGANQLLQLAADRIQAAGTPYTSVYLYMLRDGELVLDAWHMVVPKKVSDAYRDPL